MKQFAVREFARHEHQIIFVVADDIASGMHASVHVVQTRLVVESFSGVWTTMLAMFYSVKFMFFLIKYHMEPVRLQFLLHVIQMCKRK